MNPEKRSNEYYDAFKQGHHDAKEGEPGEPYEKPGTDDHIEGYEDGYLAGYESKRK